MIGRDLLANAPELILISRFPSPAPNPDSNKPLKNNSKSRRFLACAASMLRDLWIFHQELSRTAAFHSRVSYPRNGDFPNFSRLSFQVSEKSDSSTFDTNVTYDRSETPAFCESHPRLDPIASACPCRGQTNTIAPSGQRGCPYPLGADDRAAVRSLRDTQARALHPHIRTPCAIQRGRSDQSDRGVWAGRPAGFRPRGWSLAGDCSGDCRTRRSSAHS
jgi:hypothetical protein